MQHMFQTAFNGGHRKAVDNACHALLKIWLTKEFNWSKL